ncbi:MAG: hypothetical protein HY774_03100 [Acidobacteria bacterium]|nr:hypothetical protein [Acidobacteriota bacterium]
MTTFHHSHHPLTDCSAVSISENDSCRRFFRDGFLWNKLEIQVQAAQAELMKFQPILKGSITEKFREGKSSIARLKKKGKLLKKYLTIRDGNFMVTPADFILATCTCQGFYLGNPSCFAGWLFFSQQGTLPQVRLHFQVNTVESPAFRRSVFLLPFSKLSESACRARLKIGCR